MGKIRILHFELDKHLGGIEMFLLNLMSQMDRERFQFDFVAASEYPANGQKLIDLGGTIHQVPSHKQVLEYRKAVRELVSQDYDVIHVHKNSAANIIPVIEAKRAGKRVFVHSHNTSPSKGKISYFLHRYNKNKLNNLADVKIACSKEAGNWLFTDNDFYVMPNGIRTDMFRYDELKAKKTREELGISDGVFICGNIGRFTPQKNQKRLIDIFSQIALMHPASKLLLVGDGDLKDEIASYIEKRKLRDRVILTGVRSDIPNLLMAMDAFVMPSLYEGLPIVAIEAQAAGLPLVVSDTVSKEVELTDKVSWFSLGESDRMIADRIIQRSNNAADNSGMKDSAREQYSDIVKAKGFDISDTAWMISKLYDGEEK